MVSEEEQSKLPEGKPLGTDELIEYLPALGEVPKGVYQRFGKDAAVLREFRAGEIICQEGEFGSTAFYIVTGSVDVFLASPMAHVDTKLSASGFFGKTIAKMASILSPTPSAEGAADENRRTFIPVDASVDLSVKEPLAVLGKGELFGEMTCRTFQPRSATVRAREDCVMVEMLRVLLDMLLGTREVSDEVKQLTKVKAPTFKGTSFKEQLDRVYLERSLTNHLRQVAIFRGLEASFIEDLKSRVALKTYHKGHVICKQGDLGDVFYLIRQGMVKVAQSMPGGEMVRSYLIRGDYFGEVALLSNKPRNATCTAASTVDVVEIGAADFQEMVERHPEVREALEKVAQERSGAAPIPEVQTSLRMDVALNDGLLQAQNLLLIDLNKCTRCDLCVHSCAGAHDGISRLLRDGLRYDRYLVATACRSCQDPLCMTQCPVGSIRRRRNLEIVIEDWCIGCSKCAELCPYGNISMHPVEFETIQSKAKKDDPKEAAKKQSTKATTCDLCMELATPSCVYGCPHDAAMRVSPGEFFKQHAEENAF